MLKVQHPRVRFMDPLPQFSQPAFYEFRVYGRLSSQSAPWFAGLEISVDDTDVPAQTILQGYIEDQAALYGLISRIRDLGMTLVSVNQIER